LKKLRPKTRRPARKSHETVYEADSYCDLDLGFEAYCSVFNLSDGKSEDVSLELYSY